MPTLLAAAYLAVLLQEPVFENPSLGFAFSYPATWTRANEKTNTRFTIPLSGDKKATLNVFDVDFRASIEIWTTVEKTSAENLKLNLMRQWQEEILGVPLLLAKTAATEDGFTQITLSGLLYSASNRKLRFRLTADAGAFDEAELAWRNTLVSLRTTSGSLPSVESPDRNPEVIPVVKPPTLFPRVKPKMTGRLPKVEVVASPALAEKKLNLLAPTGWTSAKTDVGWALRNPKLSGEIVVTLLATEEANPPGRVLMKESALRLADFESVASRRDTAAQNNLLGSAVVWTYRTGKSKSGELFSFEGVVLSDDEKSYALCTYRSADGARMKADQEALIDLFSAIRLEAAP